MFWIFIMFTNLLIPFIMLAFGREFKKNSPQTINGVYGYRTRMSMMNKETWDYAHKLCGEIWTKLGWFLTLLTILGMIFFVKDDAKIIGSSSFIFVFVQLVAMFASIYYVEKGLRKNFDKQGNPIE